MAKNNITLDRKLKNIFKLFEDIDNSIEYKEQRQSIPLKDKNISKNMNYNLSAAAKELSSLNKEKGVDRNNFKNSVTKELSKAQLNYNKNNEIFERLHNEKQYLIEKKKQDIIDNDISWREGLFKPSISKASQNIIRNPNNFHQRLYTPPKIVSDVSIEDIPELDGVITNKTKKESSSNFQRGYSERSTNYLSNSNTISWQKKTSSDQFQTIREENKKYNNDNSLHHKSISYSRCEVNSHQVKNRDLTFEPKLCENSRRIASSINYSPQSLFEKKKKKKPDKTANKNNIIVRPLNECIKMSQAMYQRSIDNLQNKEKSIEIIKKQRENNQPIYSFDPFDNKNNKHRSQTIIKKSNTEKLLNFSKRNKSWDKERENHKDKLIRKCEEKEEISHTFKPKINLKEMKDDEKLILKGINNINEYVTKKRNFIRITNDAKNYYNKKNCYCNKFKALKRKITNNPIHNYSSINDRVIKDLKIIRSESPNLVLNQRNTLGTLEFFEHSDVNSIGQLNMSTLNYKEEDFKNAIKQLSKRF